MNFNHIPVLLNESISALNIKPDGIYVDGTAGGGGHSVEIAKRLSDKGLLICLDRDEDALKACKERLKDFSNIKYVHSNFSQIEDILKNLNIDKIDGFLLDLGVSSHQLDEPTRGFSYNSDAPLDMRMDKSASLSASELVNTYSANELTKIIRDYGEERFASSIARGIVREREKGAVETTFELVEIIKNSMPAFAKRDKHPAKRTFQAIRIAVNDELKEIRNTLNSITHILNTGGRIAVISFHSLEDRIVKLKFLELAMICSCPPTFPICVCGIKPKFKIITKKAVIADDSEVEINPRSKGAKLRVAERLREM